MLNVWTLKQGMKGAVGALGAEIEEGENTIDFGFDWMVADAGVGVDEDVDVNREKKKEKKKGKGKEKLNEKERGK